MESIVFRILKFEELGKLEEEIDKLGDLAEREARSKLIEDIIDKIGEYDLHIRKYEYEKYMEKLLNRGIEFIPLERTEIVSMWDDTFNCLVEEQKKSKMKNYNNQFRWHLFSFELLHAKCKADAKAAFDSQNKNILYLFHDDSQEAYLIKNAHLLNAADIDVLNELCGLGQADIYLFDSEEKWTYIKTHEGELGPYYFCAKKIDM